MRKRKRLSGIFYAVGLIMMLLVVALCLPLALPRLLGFEAYAIISGSMEPQIPVGSLVYAKAMAPEEVEAGDVIVFYGGRAGEAVTTHRVVENRNADREFITRGDANAGDDMEARPYESLIGRVEHILPHFGRLSLMMSMASGKTGMVCFLGAALIFCILGGVLKKDDREGQLEDKEAGKDSGREPAKAGGAVSSSSGMPTEGTVPGKRAVKAIIIVLLAIFLCSVSVLAVNLYRYWSNRQLYKDAAGEYTYDAMGKNSGGLGNGNEGEGSGKGGDNGNGEEKPPIAVDFHRLQEMNGDVAGWIYCEGTPINYPVMKGADNDFYLGHSYDGANSRSGSIFVEAANRPGFADANTILYGHHMKDGAMFASLEKWADQEFYEEHPVMWLFTPKQDYKVILFSGYTTSANSEAYTIFSDSGKELEEYLEKCIGKSDFEADVSDRIQEEGTGNIADKYIVLSTCSYVFEDARYVIHGFLVPVG